MDEGGGSVVVAEALRQRAVAQRARWEAGAYTRSLQISP
jgi:hypothetical protein